MVSVSLCMIVKNEENTLPHCLDSVRDIADEIIIVDTGSTDHTVQIAQQYTDLLYAFQWRDDFAAARNFSFSKATKDYILWLDADDILQKKDRELFMLLKSDLTPKIDTVIMKYILKRDECGIETNVCYRERLVKRQKGFLWQDAIHEYIDFSKGTILHTEIAVTHTKEHSNSERNLRILKKTMNSLDTIPSRYYFYYARESQDAGDLAEAEKYYLEFLSLPNDAQSHYVETCLQLARLYLQQDRRKEALKILVRSFEYGPLRAEVLCVIGRYYLESRDYVTAVSWFELALAIPKPLITWQFILPEYWNFLPCLELCHCYFMLGDIQRSYEFHQKTKELRPQHEIVIKNTQLFREILGEIS